MVIVNLGLNFYLSIDLFTRISNLNDFRSEVLSTELREHAALLNPKVVPEILPVCIAAQNAVASEKFKKLRTKSLPNELIFNLSPSQAITQSLKTFGVPCDEQNLLLVTFLREENSDFRNHLVSKIKGTIIDLSNLKNYSDLTAVKRTYKITEEELNVSTLSDSIATRVATKDVL